jgi:hypothetical protein
LDSFWLSDVILLGGNTDIVNKTLSAWNSALLERPPVVQLLWKVLTFYGNQRFITVFTKALHWSLS